MIKQTLMVLFSAIVVFTLVFGFSLYWNVVPGQAAAGEVPGISDGAVNAPTEAETSQGPIHSPIVQVAAVMVCVLFALLAIFPLFIVDRINEENA